MRVAVTGGAGRLGRKVVTDLLGAGWEVVSLDRTKPSLDQGCPVVCLDFSDFGQTVGALTGVDRRHGGVDAVAHLAAIPGPGHLPNEPRSVALTYRMGGQAADAARSLANGDLMSQARPSIQ